jgi:small subunit ribosomal protein S6
MKYELFYLIGISKESDVPKIKDEVSALVKSLGGVFEEKETVEKRRLAYDIKHEKQGIYIAQRFELDNLENLQELNNKLNLRSDVFRFIISKADELPGLRTKEEREKQSLSQTNRKPSLKKETPLEKKSFHKSEKMKNASASEIEKSQKETSASKEDIDKKLEEILNI